MTRIAVVGLGAVGGAIASRLCGDGRHEVEFATRTVFDELVVETHEGKLLTTRPRFLANSDAARPMPWVFLATKAHQTIGAGDWLRSLTDGNSAVAILQNGVEHIERVRPLVTDGASLVPVVVECPCSSPAPGRVLQRGPAELVVPKGKAGEELAELFAGTDISVRISPRFIDVAWSKLCLNVAGGAVTALTGRGQGVVRSPEVARLARGLIAECIAVARAEGARLDDALIEEIVAAMQAAPVRAGTSMLSDRRAGRLLEADARNGAVVRIGARHGIPTPLNRALTALLLEVNVDEQALH